MSRLEFHIDPDRLAPEFTEAGELVGLRAGDDLLPFPGLGLETELGGVVPGAGGQVQRELECLLKSRGGLPAAARGEGQWSAAEAERQFHTFGSSYQEGDHLEVNTFLHRDAAGARRNLENAFGAAQGFVDRSRAPIILHAAGCDGQKASWSSLHVNVPISDLTYRRFLRDQREGLLAYTWYLPAQLSLHAVDGNGGVGRRGLLISDRAPYFDRVFGTGTMRPSRAMVVDRAEGFGCARVMGMLRGLSFGAASVAGLLATQVDCFLLELVVHGILELPPWRISDPVAAGQAMARVENVRETASLQARIQEVRWAVVETLSKALGDDVVSRLLPGWATHLSFIDATLGAIGRGDEAEILVRCDWARKHHLMRSWLGAKGASFDEARDELVEINVHYGRLDAQALRSGFPSATLPEGLGGSGIPEDTSSWLLHWLVAKGEADTAWWDDLFRADVSWSGVESAVTTWMDPVGGPWPWAQRRVLRLDLVPWSFTRRAYGGICAQAGGLEDLLQVCGTARVIYGDATGRRLERTDGDAPPTRRDSHD